MCTLLSTDFQYYLLRSDVLSFVRLSRSPGLQPEPQAAEPEPESESDAELSWVHCATNVEDVHCSRFQLGILFYI